MAWCECFGGMYWEKYGGARNEKDKEKIKLKWECEGVDMEYFGEGYCAVLFAWFKNEK